MNIYLTNLSLCDNFKPSISIVVFDIRVCFDNAELIVFALSTTIEERKQ